MRRRFIIALILAIFPFALLTAGQSVWRLVRAYDDARETLMTSAEAATAKEAEVVARAEATLVTLANQPAIKTASADCPRDLASALAGLPDYTNIVRLNAAGTITCSALALSPDILDRSQQSWWTLLLERRAFLISERRIGAATAQQVLTAAVPVFVGDRFDGGVALFLKSDALVRIMHERSLSRNALAALIDAKGQIIAASSDDLARTLFPAPLRLTDGPLQKARDGSDNAWLFAVAPVLNGDLFLAFGERESALFVWSYLDVAANILLPLLIAAFAFIAIWLSADRFVLRWITYLQRVARAYGKGHLSFQPVTAAAGAPEEIRQLAAAMGEMAQNIRQRDQSLRHALEQRSMMLREIHHRVKNNLQIVGSLLQLEASRIEEPSLREVMKITQTRINAIALAHRILEEVGSQTVVNIKTLLSDLSMLLHDAFSGDRYSEGVTVSAPSILVETDVAVPLSLLLVERLAAIYRAALAEGHATLSLTITAEARGETEFELTIAYDSVTLLPRNPRSPDFAGAYVRQLRAQLETTDRDGRTQLRIVAPTRSLYKA